MSRPTSQFGHRRGKDAAPTMSSGKGECTVHDTDKRGRRSLRNARISLTGHTYFVTSNTANIGVYLAEPKCAEIVMSSLQWLRERGRIELHAYAVMPDHLHLVLTLGEQVTLAQIMQALKGYTAQRINELAGRKGRVWEKGYYEHGIRDQEDMRRRVKYTVENPERAGLVEQYEEWPYSSAHESRRVSVDPW